MFYDLQVKEKSPVEFVHGFECLECSDVVECPIICHLVSFCLVFKGQGT